jgi:hypothetical protein
MVSAPLASWLYLQRLAREARREDLGEKAAAIAIDTVEVDFGPERLKGLLGVPVDADGLAAG